MASTDAKSGFRLPWSSDRNDDEDTSAESATVDPSQPQNAESETPTMIDSPAQTAGQAETDDPAATAGSPATSWATSTPPAPAVSRKPNKFMADLTKAMQAAAEAARADSLDRFSVEAKAHIESIHATTADEATELRKKADEDITGIRDWSKAEVARIREETDERIAHRKEVLEREIEAHAAQIEARIERVQSRVTSFESEMAAFFERLLAEEDPTRFAAMAETMPEPPSFDVDDASATWAPVESPAAIEAPSAVGEPATVGESATPAIDSWATAPNPVVEATETTSDATEPVAERSGWEAVEAPAAVDEPTAATSAADSVAEPVAEASAETPVEAPVDNGDLFGITAPEATDTDPRLSALGMAQDFAAAEAEAAAFPSETTADDAEIPTIAEDALAARLAGLVADEPAQSNETASTRVVVTGLVSVASIAGFKRNLARVSGVRSVGVSSGPDGEFVFAVTHDPGLDLTDGIATLPGFGARVTNEAAGELTVAARDPESEG
jgi:hypothetical protein